ncbi:type VI secretion protein IcmF/TssM N-terminal domain-containing protein [Halomonas binhaiensis]|uniref:ImcF-like protein n=1 Tax=Halomonas binhaiensis TaxID=2562282 RepID=A0A5C1NE52_9GAMM|nr:type VI secretion protein IcmF/TssM N-terminal domain-containing protein [Halomonas binhaiensis]QEM81524.1 ImcF-like protein [Halomonas binhaiensis]
MRRLLGVLKSFWLVSIVLWLIGVGLCVWWIPRLGGGPQRLAIAVALLTAVWLLAVVLRKYRKVRADRGIEELVTLEVNREAASAASQSGDYEVLRERLKAALGMLKARGGSKSSLSELPWFLVLGHSASGKTSLLSRSGLNTSVAGIGAETGTQYCDWYFGNDAVLIDTAGRYIAEEQPAQEFAEFLKLLAKRRKRNPINGLVVVVDLPALLRGSREDSYALAQQLIERIDEYHAAMDAAPPVYLCFSKADLVPGFVEAFSRLDSDARQRPWGMSFSLAEIRGKGMRQAFSERFESLIASLRAHVDRRVIESGLEANSELLRFPDYVNEIRNPLMDFLEPFDLRHNPDSAPLARGLYFTSALQRGDVIAPVFNQAASKMFALNRTTETASQARGERSYFIQGLFRDVVIADRNLVEHHSRNGRRRSLHLWLVGAGVLAGLGVIGLMAHAFWNNRAGLMSFEEQLASVEQADDATKLETLQGELARLHQQQREGVALWEDAGLDSGDKLRPDLEDTYFSALKGQVLAPIAANLGQQLAEVGALADSLGLDVELPSAAADNLDQQDYLANAAGQGSEMLDRTGERLQDRLTQRPTLGSVPRSPGELASRLRGEADYRLRGSVNDAYWSARSDGREALREGARNAWENAQNGGLEEQLAESEALSGIGPSFSAAALSELEPSQVSDLIDAYDALKLYLVLTDPEAHPEVDFVKEALPRAWQRLAEHDSQVPQGDQLISDNVALYAAYLEEGKAPALDRDERLVAQARANLKAFLVQASPADREYLRLRLAAEKQFPALTLSDILPKADLPLMYSGEAVPAFFTQRVWQEFVQPELAKTLASDLNVERDWVLEGDSELDAVQSKAQFARAVLARYKRDYIYAWERFLAGAGVRRFEGLEASRKNLTQLSDYQRSPLKILLQVVDANTRWDNPDAEQRQASGDSEEKAPQDSTSPGFWKRTMNWVSGSDQMAEQALAQSSDMPSIHDGILARHFEPVGQLFRTDAGAEDDATHMDRYLLLLRQFKVRLDSLERGDVGKRTKQLVSDVIGGRPNEITELHNYVAANIDTSRDELVQSVQRLFRDPVDFAVASLDGPISGQLAGAWGEQISRPWNKMVGGRYPVSNSSNEASVRDLRHFVDPNSGLLASFDENEVGNLAEANRNGEPLVDPLITATIAQGTGVGEVLDSLADVENGFEIMIQPSPNLTAITLSLDGQQLEYRNGPQSWQRFTWPGDGRQAGARMDVMTFGGTRVKVFDFPSRWGLLRMVDSADVANLDDVRQRLTWYTSVGPVSITVRNFGGVKLTDLDKVRRLRIPALGAR